MTGGFLSRRMIWSDLSLHKITLAEDRKGLERGWEGVGQGHKGSRKISVVWTRDDGSLMSITMSEMVPFPSPQPIISNETPLPFCQGEQKS